MSGSVRHRRAYYRCRHCQQGHSPADAELGLETHWSPTLVPVVTLLGAIAPFAQACDDLDKVAGLHVAPDPARRPGFSLPPQDARHVPGTVAYIGLDAFAVPTRGAEGVDWKMLYVGLMYDPPKKPTLCLVDSDVGALAATLRRYATASGVGRAETLVALTDGGNGLERWSGWCVRGSVVRWRACWIGGI